jgi:hypothetical protein
MRSEEAKRAEQVEKRIRKEAEKEKQERIEEAEKKKLDCWKKVVLYKKDTDECRHDANLRNGKEEMFGARIHTESKLLTSPKESLIVHIKGLLGEKAVCVATGVPFNRTIYKRRGDKRADLLSIPEKHFDPSVDPETMTSAEIKTTTLDNGPLAVRIKDYRKDVPYYISCYVDRASLHADVIEVVICGYATNEQVRKAKKDRLSPEGPMNYIVDDTELHKFHI